MKTAVITSINPPTSAVREIAKRKDVKLIVIGDTNSPSNWHYNNVVYCSPQQQYELGYNIVEYLPWNHYSRKMIGYILSAREGAQTIIDIDDDNIPYSDWDFPEFDGAYTHLKANGYINIYRYFTDEHVWPRGLPLNLVTADWKASILPRREARVGIWQFLADGDPDVDAVYRLVVNKPIKFAKREPVVLSRGAVAPVNSQNTAFRRELFALLYLPATVTFRFTDILRGIVATPILWKFNYNIGFGQASVLQERNPHDYMRDFVDEIPMYTQGDKALNVVASAIQNETSVESALFTAYEALTRHQIVQKSEMHLLQAWIKDIAV